jgi:hypothetical protein
MTLLLTFSAINWALTWAEFYLMCFVVGFALTLLTFLAGSMHLHLPTKWHMGGHVHGSGPHVGAAAKGSGVSIFNFSTVVAFLVWFGGTGYLLTHYGRIEVLLGFVVAVVGGVVGASIVFWFLVKLLSFDNTMDPADYDRVGLIGRVNVVIREGTGTGEVVFSQAGTRRVSGARSDDGSYIAKGTEVVITRYERGIAYVKPWNEFAGEAALGRDDVRRKDESDSAAAGGDGRKV